MMRFIARPDHGEPIELTVGSRDVLMWERTGHKRSFADIRDNPTMVAMYEIAHIAARRTGAFTGTRDEFEQRFELDVIDDTDDPDGGDADPTQPDR